MTGLAPARLVEPVHDTSFLKKQPMTLPLALVLAHLFHRGTRHRGQITTLISQLGHELGTTDMVYMPGVAGPSRGVSPWGGGNTKALNAAEASGRAWAADRMASLRRPMGRLRLSENREPFFCHSSNRLGAV